MQTSQKAPQSEPPRPCSPLREISPAQSSSALLQEPRLHFFQLARPRPRHAVNTFWEGCSPKSSNLSHALSLDCLTSRLVGCSCSALSFGVPTPAPSIQACASAPVPFRPCFARAPGPDPSLSAAGTRVCARVLAGGLGLEASPGTRRLEVPAAAFKPEKVIKQLTRG